MTPVIFRKFKRAAFDKKAQGIDPVIALFPTLPGDNTSATCASYMHVGQHGSATVTLFYADTSPAHETEYRALLRELIGQGYDDLRIYTRYQPGFTKQRLDALKR